MQLDPHRSLLGVLDGIADEIGEDLFVADAIYLNPAGLAGGEFQLQVLLSGQRSEYGDHRSRQRRDFIGLRLQFKPTGLYLGNVQNIANQAQQIIGRTMGDGE